MTYLNSLHAGADIDHRGTTFTQSLLNELLNAFTTGTDIRIGEALFGQAIFLEETSFDSVSFEEPSDFSQAIFLHDASFHASIFAKGANFNSVTFSGSAFFHEMTFGEGGGSFEDVKFAGEAVFDTVITDYGISFAGAIFNETEIGPIRLKRSLNLYGTVFNGAILMEVSALHISCARTRFMGPSFIKVSNATLDLSGAFLAHPLTLATADTGRLVMLEEALSVRSRKPASVESLRGVDCAMLTLTNVKLTDCWFAGAVHLDQLRLEGDCSFSKFHRPHNQRKVIAEEKLLRVQSARFPRLSPWRFPSAPIRNDIHTLPEPDVLASVYRQLRKSREDAKDEPGAADFYYGEMEMRRHKRSSTLQGERWLLQLYWLLSGYGLRASRALGWLALAMMTTILLMMGFGLPQDSPKQRGTGIVPLDGGKVTFEIDKDDPQNPTHDRFTTKRFEKALSVTLNSVVFRSSGQDLTTAGGYIEMASRFSQPVLLGLAALAIRGRVKR
jgi:uncharacterized protein YjbI with pentapeptide repeats